MTMPDLDREKREMFVVPLLEEVDGIRNSINSRPGINSQGEFDETRLNLAMVEIECWSFLEQIDPLGWELSAGKAIEALAHTKDDMDILARASALRLKLQNAIVDRIRKRGRACQGEFFDEEERQMFLNELDEQERKVKEILDEVLAFYD